MAKPLADGLYIEASSLAVRVLVHPTLPYVEPSSSSSYDSEHVLELDEYIVYLLVSYLISAIFPDDYEVAYLEVCGFVTLTDGYHLVSVSDYGIR